MPPSPMVYPHRNGNNSTAPHHHRQPYHHPSPGMKLVLEARDGRVKVEVEAVALLGGKEMEDDVKEG